MPDPALFVGEKFVEDEGEPARSVTVTRKVYVEGEVLYDETWVTTYQSEPRIVRVGTIPLPTAPPAPPPPADDEQGGTTGTTTTAPTTTAPTSTGTTTG